MYVDINWIERNFTLMNARFFGGRLPIPRFVIDNSSKHLGQCSYTCKRNRFGHRVGPMHYTIRISNYYSRPESNILNTLLHEMIHLHFYSIGKLNVGHGPEFQEMGRSFDRYGFNIKTCSDLCSDIHPRLNKDDRGNKSKGLSPLWLLIPLVLFVAWTFVSNPDAMMIMSFAAGIVAENLQAIGQTIVENIVNNHFFI